MTWASTSVLSRLLPSDAPVIRVIFSGSFLARSASASGTAFASPALVKPLIPNSYLPDSYLPYPVPGFGLIIGFVGLTLLGFLTANLVGRSLIGAGEAILDRMPVIRSLYKGVKQVFETIFSQSGTSFRKVGMVQFPQPGMWSIVFIAQEAASDIAESLPDGNEQVGVFLPCTPNPTTGFFFYLPRREVVELSISVEDGAKLIMSAGLIQPGEPNGKPKIETKPPVNA